MVSIKTLRNRIVRLETVHQDAPVPPYFVLDGTEASETLARVRREVDAYEKDCADGIPAYIVRVSQ